MVLGDTQMKTPYGASAREAIDAMDLAALAPEKVPLLAMMELGDAIQRDQPMAPQRIRWWIEQSFEAGQRAAVREQAPRSAAGGAGGPALG